MIKLSDEDILPFCSENVAYSDWERIDSHLMKVQVVDRGGNIVNDEKLNDLKKNIFMRISRAYHALSVEILSGPLSIMPKFTDSLLEQITNIQDSSTLQFFAQALDVINIKTKSAEGAVSPHIQSWAMWFSKEMFHLMVDYFSQRISFAAFKEGVRQTITEARRGLDQYPYWKALLDQLASFVEPTAGASVSHAQKPNFFNANISVVPILRATSYLIQNSL